MRVSTGTWQFPGGHLEPGEELLDCGARETLEETGLEIEGKGVFTITNDVFLEEGKHYITIFAKFVMKDPSQVPKVRLSGIMGGKHGLLHPPFLVINQTECHAR